MIARILDRLFGKRHVKGWPRGVQPFSPRVSDLKNIDPELWEETRYLPMSEATRMWQARHPEMSWGRLDKDLTAKSRSTRVMI